MVEGNVSPRIDNMTRVTVQRAYIHVVRAHTGSGNVIVTIFTLLTAYRAVIEKRRCANGEAGRGVTTVARCAGDNVIGRLSYGEYVVMAFLALNGKFFEQSAYVALLTFQPVM
jgi:hypothetical protein